uniref:(California timema) hypothetical protein n=1 Tax=Timema californicum TaxID=61474 RepID=A0A7R9P7Q9_TIMCA|nr:unnamed protein product [Timema californicum]
MHPEGRPLLLEHRQLQRSHGNRCRPQHREDGTLQDTLEEALKKITVVPGSGAGVSFGLQPTWNVVGRRKLLASEPQTSQVFLERHPRSTGEILGSMDLWLRYLTTAGLSAENLSNKLKPFWLSITEKESLPVLDFLSAALLSAEYERALCRALAMTECRVVPFFGAFLHELREILATTPSLVVLAPPGEQARLEVRRPLSSRRRASRRRATSHRPVVSHPSPRVRSRIVFLLTRDPYQVL